uniref:SCAN box domain-containing protein n=1 Tax=Gadus morhua TaxID=8049 RepID=A0A8C5B7G4_GADMO
GGGGGGEPHRRLGAAGESRDGVFELDVFGGGVGEHVDRERERPIIYQCGGTCGRGEGPRGAGPVANIHVPKMGEADDAEAFQETFQGVAEVSGWPRQDWAHRLLPLLTGEAQLAAHCLPAGAQRDYGTIARAIRDRLGLYPEEHRRRFRTLAFTDVVEQVALERFVEGLQARTSAWVRYHRPESLSAAVDLAESHLQPQTNPHASPDSWVRLGRVSTGC